MQNNQLPLGGLPNQPGSYPQQMRQQMSPQQLQQFQQVQLPQSLSQPNVAGPSSLGVAGSGTSSFLDPITFLNAQGGSQRHFLQGNSNGQSNLPTSLLQPQMTGLAATTMALPMGTMAAQRSSMSAVTQPPFMNQTLGNTPMDPNFRAILSQTANGNSGNSPRLPQNKMQPQIPQQMMQQTRTTFSTPSQMGVANIPMDFQQHMKNASPQIRMNATMNNTNNNIGTNNIPMNGTSALFGSISSKAMSPQPNSRTMAGGQTTSSPLMNANFSPGNVGNTKMNMNMNNINNNNTNNTNNNVPGRNGSPLVKQSEMAASGRSTPKSALSQMSSMTMKPGISPVLQFKGPPAAKLPPISRANSTSSSTSNIVSKSSSISHAGSPSVTAKQISVPPTQISNSSQLQTVPISTSKSASAPPPAIPMQTKPTRSDTTTDTSKKRPIDEAGPYLGESRDSSKLVKIETELRRPSNSVTPSGATTPGSTSSESRSFLQGLMQSVVDRTTVSTPDSAAVCQLLKLNRDILRIMCTLEKHRTDSCSSADEEVVRDAVWGDGVIQSLSGRLRRNIGYMDLILDGITEMKASTLAVQAAMPSLVPPEVPREIEDLHSTLYPRKPAK